jgi:L-aminopeptidase/D-esterase-like protein
MYNAITDIPGLRVGHAQNLDALTGCTVILCEAGAVGGVDQRGGAPGTRETDLLHPLHLVEKVHAILLAGGSAFGLDAATGVMRYLEARGVGFDVGVARVPLVPAAILFDLSVGRADVRPAAAMGYAACQNASAEPPAQGNVGEQTNKVAQMAHDGLARAIRPAHLMADGDTIFALSTGEVAADVNTVGSFAAEAFAQAIVNAVLMAEPLADLPAARDFLP